MRISGWSSDVCSSDLPTGAKGGFHPKHLPSPADRDAWLKEGTEAYRIYIRALLSLTDNIVDGAVVHSDHVVCGDNDDPYFVVAADKGTASFYDIANVIALERGFWKIGRASCRERG